MTSDIKMCAEWERRHDRPVYTLGERCPECDGPAVNSAPAPFDPTDQYGEYRRRAKRRRGAASDPDGTPASAAASSSSSSSSNSDSNSDSGSASNDDETESDAG